MITVTVDLSPTPDAPLGFTPCRRCKATPGFVASRVAHNGIPGLCFDCDGHGKIRVKTPEEIAAEKAWGQAQDRRSAAVKAVKALVRQDADTKVRVAAALNRLECDEPERFMKMVEAVHAGKIKAVVTHLVSYENAAREVERAEWEASRRARGLSC